MPAAGEIICAFGIDERYAPHLSVVLASIVANAPGARFRFLIIHDGVSQAERAKVESCAPGQTFQWEEVSDSEILKLDGRDYISRATFYRFAITEFAPEDASRVIYLDSDLVVTGDLRELWETDLRGGMIGAVFDVGLDAAEFAARFGLPWRRLGYFNAGVLLLDIAAIRESNAFAPALELLRTRMDELPYMDQDALNHAFWGRWTLIDPVWNTQRMMVIRHEGRVIHATHDEMQIQRRPKIIHFTEKDKPWLPGAYHPYIWKYFEALQRTPYWGEVSKASAAGPLKQLRRRIRTGMNWRRLTA